MLERDVERAVVHYARTQKGLLVLKLTPVGVRGYPDRIFLCPNGRTFFIEFKRPGPGAGVGAIQRRRIAELQGLGFQAAVINNIEEGMRFVDECTAAG